MENNKENRGLNLEISKEVAGGTYSNLALITHSASEFIVDFAKTLPGLPKPTINSRIIMTPEHAKRLYLALQDNITKYEKQNGPIILSSGPKETFPMGFGPNTAEA